MDERDITLLKIEKAKAFWKNVDVDDVFEVLLQHLARLKESIKTNTASDKEYLQGLNLLQDCEMNEVLNLKHYAIEQVVIGEDYLKSDLGCLQLSFKEEQLSVGLLVPDPNISYEDSQEFELANYQPLKDPVTPLSPHPDIFDVMLLSPPPYSVENALGQLYSPQAVFEPHDCSAACVVILPSHPDHFLGHNPLRAPLLCQFRRHCSSKTRFSTAEDVPAQITDDDEDGDNEEVFYNAPCGRELRGFEEVLNYLRQTQVFGVLQPWNFSFHPVVRPERLPVSASSLCKRDLSRGVESVAVQLCNEVDSAQPAEFRYRRERWPHGCFLSAGELFSACCDCTDGCTDSRSCACLQLSQKVADGPVQFYTHQRLQQAVPTGLYECSPWCGCDPYNCLNRVVQHGVRVRLQVFRTPDRGWGVRCRDDLDVGTFVCTYAGVVLRTEQNSEESPVLKSIREEAFSDDEVEVVEEWTLPTLQQTGLSATAATDPCSPSHIPVIQRPTDHPALPADGDKDTVKTQDHETLVPAGKVAQTTVEEKMEMDEEPQLEKEERGKEEVKKEERGKEEVKKCGDSKLRTGPQEWKYSCSKQSYYLDATKEGNVGRFINSSGSPNLFVQNVFVDTHDPQFPVMAFFTSRTVKAGTELTWNYSPHDVNGD
ncbi:histone-lysine N-methyltransferase SETDB2 [Alosa pseudoharengus]|uniref:histone-lysine N-methyltransferase SETDB2 n=1 Tax=Alosa pseudoharengus TaxID=34774 RepID=UPI003F8A1300